MSDVWDRAIDSLKYDLVEAFHDQERGAISFNDYIDRLITLVRPAPPQDIEGRDWIGNPDGTLVYWQKEAEDARAKGAVLNQADAARDVPGGQAKQVWAVLCPACSMWLPEWNSEFTEAEQVLREHQDEMHD